MPKKLSRWQEIQYYRKKRKQIFKEAYQKELLAAKRERRKKRVKSIQKQARVKAQHDVKPLRQRIAVRAQQTQKGAQKMQKGLQSFNRAMGDFQKGISEGAGGTKGKGKRMKSLDEIVDDCLKF